MSTEKLSKEKLAEKAQEVFDSNPKMTKGHQATDGQVFERLDNAVAHQILLTKDGNDVREVYPIDKKTKASSHGKVVDLTTLKFEELQSLCMDREYPIEEWENLKGEKEVIDYINSKAPQE